uniref:Fatty acid amide hydrolase n=1 Tax=Neolamprologus brichardi TaxID=32507 RepID=A0A3Q4M8G9_NEOBR
ACIVGYLVVRVKKINSLRQAEEKIKRARNRRDESLQRAEQEVLHYKQSHPTTDSAFILTLSLSELTQQLNEGSLTPEDVFYSYMEKVQYPLHNCLQSPKLSCGCSHCFHSDRLLSGHVGQTLQRGSDRWRGSTCGGSVCCSAVAG